MKKIACLLIIFILTGCGVEYKINISNDTVEESIDINLLIDKNKSSNEVEIDLNSSDYINSLKQEDINAIVDSETAIYDKKITNDGNMYNISLNYKYNNGSYAKSRVVNECFENHEVNYNGNKVYIHLYGTFYCFKDEDVNIIVNSENKVVKSNGEKNGNSYKWVINSNNYKNVDIELETTDKVEKKHSSLIVVLIVLGVLGAFVAFYVMKIVKSQDVNDI